MTEMKRFIYAVLAVAATLSFAACSQENDINTPGASGKNTLAFTVGAATRAEAGAPVVEQGQLIPLGEPIGDRRFFLEETVVSLDDPSFFATAETRGTPVYTENFETMSGGSFKGAAFPVATMTNGKITNAVYPNGNWADFTKNGEFWENSYEWDPWYDQDALLFYAKMLTEDPSAPATQVGVITSSYTFLNDANGQSMSFSYRSAAKAEDMQDILFAARSITKQEARKAVPILFYHALTGVKFATAYDNGDDVKTYIKKVELTGLYGYGKCYITSTAENGEYSDITANHSSASAVRWDFTVSGAAPSLSNVYYQDYPDDYVSYTGGSFTNKGNYPDSFSAAGNTKNLNDGDATMTFWFPAQRMTNNVVLTVTYEVELDGVRKEYKNTLELGKTLLAQDAGKNAEWKAGQLRTFTLKPNGVNVDIHDEVSGFKKDNVQIRNTGNVDAYIRATLVANWWGTAGTEECVAYGYINNTGTAYITPWSMSWDNTANKYVDNYGGEFTGLPAPGASGDWVRAKDGYFYYKNPVPPGKYTGEPTAEDPLFDEYNLNTTDHPVPRIYYLDGTMKEFTKVYLRMEIAVQAIEARKNASGSFEGYVNAWAGAGVTVVTE